MNFHFTVFIHKDEQSSKCSYKHENIFVIYLLKLVAKMFNNSTILISTDKNAVID